MIFIDIITIFPKMFSGPFNESIVKRAIDKRMVEINIHDLRNWSTDNYKTVDDRPYGGGVGMILKCEPIFKAVEEIKKKRKKLKLRKTILLDAGGKLFNQDSAKSFFSCDHLILICGHYEGVDERVAQYLADEKISIGDYVLTGGEIPAMVVTDAVVRLLPGVLDKKEATKSESFSLKLKKEDGRQDISLLEYPQYTRPENFQGYKVPEVLLSGNHQEIEKWRMEQAVKRTKRYRPDLLA